MNKNDKVMLTEEYTKVWHSNERMINYCVKNTVSYADVKGKVIPIDTTSIQKNFCFGYSDSKYDTESFDRANAMAERASKDVIYFLRENHKHAGYARIIEMINSSRYMAYMIPHYCGQYEDCKIYCINFVNAWDENKIPENAIKLTKEELGSYKKALVEAIRAFTKRLNTYLKRYGMSKVNTWSYWQDR
jgi:hypothetical protein